MEKKNHLTLYTLTKLKPLIYVASGFVSDSSHFRVLKICKASKEDHASGGSHRRRTDLMWTVRILHGSHFQKKFEFNSIKQMGYISFHYCAFHR